MMMAHDSGSRSSGELPPATVAALRDALGAYAQAPNDLGRVREALTGFAEAARERQLPPEQLLVALKEVWYALPAVTAASDATEQAGLLQRVVTLCIKSYYDR